MNSECSYIVISGNRKSNKNIIKNKSIDNIIQLSIIIYL